MPTAIISSRLTWKKALQTCHTKSEPVKSETPRCEGEKNLCRFFFNERFTSFMVDP
jgi:hypothetical protein